MLSFNCICSIRTYIYRFLSLHIAYVPTFGTENIATTFLLLCQQRKIFNRRWRSHRYHQGTLLVKHPDRCHYHKLRFTMFFLGVRRLILSNPLYTLLVSPFLGLGFFRFLKLLHHLQTVESASSLFCLVLNCTRTESARSNRMSSSQDLPIKTCDLELSPSLKQLALNQMGSIKWVQLWRWPSNGLSCDCDDYSPDWLEV